MRSWILASRVVASLEEVELQPQLPDFLEAAATFASGLVTVSDVESNPVVGDIEFRGSNNLAVTEKMRFASTYRHGSSVVCC